MATRRSPERTSVGTPIVNSPYGVNLIGSGSDSVSVGDDCVAPCEHLAAAWKDLAGAKVAARWMREGHLRPMRETCDPEGREQDHIVVVIQAVIMGRDSVL
jgi:hypothetical protein